jgi:hypothetical protein
MITRASDSWTVDSIQKNDFVLIISYHFNSRHGHEDLMPEICIGSSSPGLLAFFWLSSLIRKFGKAVQPVS